VRASAARHTRLLGSNRNARTMEFRASSSSPSARCASETRAQPCLSPEGASGVS
jgi:hypothetical protein